MNKPKDINGLRDFLGIINFYIRFTPNANIQAPINEYLTKTKKKDKL